MPTEVDTILKLAVPVIVQIGKRTLSLQTVLALGPGAILELNKPADAALELLINNKPVAMGYAVKVGENFGLRVESVGSPKVRVEALRE
ncbi:MAG: FliM/FliN family flagellar motor C-terminal domain-containing protein [Phycisphaeraceae bacterium]